MKPPLWKILNPSTVRRSGKRSRQASDGIVTSTLTASTRKGGSLLLDFPTGGLLFDPIHGSGETYAANGFGKSASKPEQWLAGWVRKARALSKCVLLHADSLAEPGTESSGAPVPKATRPTDGHELERSRQEHEYPKGYSALLCSLLQSIHHPVALVELSTSWCGRKQGKHK